VVTRLGLTVRRSISGYEVNGPSGVSLPQSSWRNTFEVAVAAPVIVLGTHSANPFHDATAAPKARPTCSHVRSDSFDHLGLGMAATAGVRAGPLELAA